MEYLYIADTNLFLECKRLEDLNWADLGADPVAIILTKPVIGEIDKHKKAGGRTRRRALEISGRIREMLITGCMESTIRETNPRVVLRIAPIVKPDPDLSNVLDYSQNDDRIVGIVSELIKEAVSAEVSFLTDDSVAASTAQSLGLPFCLIDETWKRPPEETTEAKRVKELEKDLATYRAQEPHIVIRNAGEDDGSTHVVRRVPVAIFDGDIERMIADLKAKFPMQENFRVPESETLTDGTEVSFEPPDAEAIAKYQTEAYPHWVAKCQTTLKELHEGREEHEAVLKLAFGIKNNGTRPASQVRVTFEAEGQLKLRRGDTEDVAEEDDARDEIPTAKPLPLLPKPPEVPQAKRVIKRAVPRTDRLNTATPPTPLKLRGTDLDKIVTAASAIHGLKAGFGNLGIFEDITRSLAPANEAMRLFEEREKMHNSLYDGLLGSDIARRDRTFEMPALPKPFIPRGRDEEAFYFDEWPSNVPVRKGALTCDLFRHMVSEEFFEFEILFPSNGDVRGAVLCTVHAENLTEPVSFRIQVGRAVEEFSLVEQAEALVADCTK